MIPQNYEETKQWIDVLNVGKLAIKPFAPCVLIGDGELTACAINDRSVDSDFRGQPYRLAMSGSVGIPSNRYGRLSIDWPLIGRVNGAGPEEDFELLPSEDGSGFSLFDRGKIIPMHEKYPYPLGYWHWVGTGERQQFTDVVAHMYDRDEVLKRLEKDGWVLAWVASKSSRWQNQANLQTEWFRQSYQVKEFKVHEGTGQRVSHAADLSPFRSIANPEKRAYQSYFTNTVFDENRSGILVSSANQHQQSNYPRLVFTDYGLYEIEIAALILPVLRDEMPFVDVRGRAAVARYKNGIQTRVAPDATDDFWRWKFEDFVLLVNRHDFDVAKSVCDVETVEHRQPLGASGLSIRGVNVGVEFYASVAFNLFPDDPFSPFINSFGGYFAPPPDGRWYIVGVYFGNAFLRYAHSGNNPSVATIEDAWAILLEDKGFTRLNFDLGLVNEPPNIGGEIGGMPYLGVANKQAPDMILFDDTGPTKPTDEFGTHVRARFVLRIDRAKKVGKYKGVGKTVMEFRVLARSDLEATAQYQFVYGRARRFSKGMQVADD